MIIAFYNFCLSLIQGLLQNKAKQTNFTVTGLSISFIGRFVILFLMLSVRARTYIGIYIEQQIESGEGFAFLFIYELNINEKIGFAITHQS